MFGFGKKPATGPVDPSPEQIKQGSVPSQERLLNQPVEAQKGGALAFIADTEKAVNANTDAMKVRQASQIARILAALQGVADEEAPFILGDGVPPEFVTFAATGCALGAAAAAMGDLFKANKPSCDPAVEPIEIMRTVQSFANVFLSRVGL